MSHKENHEKMEVFFARCHCGRVQGRFICNATHLTALDCNCSDCYMRKNVHIVVPISAFQISMEESLEDATILYEWGTKAAARRFCKVCGIMPWYKPRSNPDGVAITIYCVDWTKNGTSQPPKIDVMNFDGANWEQSMEKHDGKISAMSTKKGAVKFDWW